MENYYTTIFVIDDEMARSSGLDSEMAAVPAGHRNFEKQQEVGT